METLQHLVPLVFTLSLAMLVFAVGLDARLEDLLFVARKPWRLLKAVLAVNLLVPIAAISLVALFPLSHVAKAGILLMAMSPVPPLVPGNELKAGAERPYAYGVYVALILLAIVLVPMTAAIIGPLYGVHLSLSIADIATNIGLTVVLPLVLGLIVHVYAPKFAAGAVPLTRTAAMVLLVLAAVPMLIAAWPAMTALVGDGTLVAISLMVLVALLGGHLLGGPAPADRVALAVTAATRHPGIALSIAAANSTDKRIPAAILTVMLVGLLVATPYKLWAKRRLARQSAPPFAARTPPARP